jgi:putative phosphoribosyl transferase
MTFENRTDAGRKLSDRIAEQRSAVDIVFAIPRGGIEVAAPIARRFGCPLRPVLVAKIRHPRHPEVAIGAIDESGQARTHDDGVGEGITEADLHLAVEAARRTLEERRKFYTEIYKGLDNGNTSALHVRGKHLWLVDDGLATGQTCRAALRWLNGLKPASLNLAVPCASDYGLGVVRRFCDDLVVLAPTESEFDSVSQYYEEFEQVSVEDTRRTLQTANHGFMRRAG